MEVWVNCGDQVQVISLGKFHMKKLLQRVKSYRLLRNNQESSEKVRHIAYIVVYEALFIVVNTSAMFRLILWVILDIIELFF